MTQETASRLIGENLPAIYGYAYGKLYNKSEAEDLSQEIALEILSSAKNLQNNKAFWGFAWKIAENTFRKFIKRREIINQSVSLENENLAEVLTSVDTDDFGERDEQIYRLRRELSLLGKRHREVCVSYYVHNKNCSSIAKEQNISVEMVKQHLFKARKLLKEGMEMERKLGEKSYNPGTFRLNFWGDWNYYGNKFDKKLPGAILLAAYNRPLTAEELSLELGVAMPYLEEEIDTLEAAGLLLKNGKKIETNIVILTDEYEKEVEKQNKPFFDSLAADVYETVKGLLPQIRELGFHGSDYDDNRLLFGLINIALIRGYEWSNYISPTGNYAKLPLGGNGWLFGHDNDYENLRFKAVTLRTNNKDNTAWYSAVNYRVAIETQNFEHRNFMDKSEAMCAAVIGADADGKYETLPWLIENKFIISQNGKLSANFPVFEDAVYDALLEKLKPVYEEIADCMVQTSANAAKLLSEGVPARLREQCVDIAKIHHRLDVAAFIMESLIEQGKLILPKEKTPICVYGVKI